jgi:hypothetical protein
VAGDNTIRPSGSLVAGLFLGLPFFEVVSVSWIRGGFPAVLVAGSTLVAVGWLLLLRPLLRPGPVKADPLAGLMSCRALSLVLRAGLMLAIVLALRMAIGGWSHSLERWVELRPPQTILSSFLSWIGAGAMSLGLRAAFAIWAISSAFRHPWRVQAAVQTLSGVAGTILVGCLLTYHRALPRMFATSGDWSAWQLSDLAGPWLYLACAALVAPALRIEQPAGSAAKAWLGPLAIGLAFTLAAILPMAWLAALRMRGVGLTGGPVDAYYLVGFIGRGPMGGEYSGSALLISLASMSTAMVLVFALRRLWTANHPRLGAAALAAGAGIGWPGLDMLTELRILHAVALALSALAGIAVAERALARRESAPWQERLAERIVALIGLAFAAFTWQSGERLLDFLPFLASAVLMAALIGVGSSSGKSAGES